MYISAYNIDLFAPFVVRLRQLLECYCTMCTYTNKHVHVTLPAPPPDPGHGQTDQVLSGGGETENSGTNSGRGHRECHTYSENSIKGTTGSRATTQGSR